MSSMGSTCAACRGEEVPEAVRLKPPMLPYFQAMGDIDEQIRVARQALEIVKQVTDPEMSKGLREVCFAQLEMIERREKEIITPLMDAVFEIKRRMSPLIQLYQECVIQLDDE